MKLILTLLSLLLCNIIFAQNNILGKDEVLFHKGIALQEIFYEDNLQELLQNNEQDKVNFLHKIRREILKVSLSNFEKIINDFPKSKYIFESYYKKAIIEYDLENTINAKIYFQKIIEFESEEHNYYKNSARLYLAEIAITEQNFTLALKYLEESKNKFNPLFTCGVERETYTNRFNRLMENAKRGIEKK